MEEYKAENQQLAMEMEEYKRREVQTTRQKDEVTRERLALTEQNVNIRDGKPCFRLEYLEYLTELTDIVPFTMCFVLLARVERSH